MHDFMYVTKKQAQPIKDELIFTKNINYSTCWKRISKRYPMSLIPCFTFSELPTQ